MKKKIILIGLIIIVLVIGLFIFKSYKNKNNDSTNSNTENYTRKESLEEKEKVKFTKEVTKNHVKYKTPEEISSIGSFKDLGYTCTIFYYTNQSSVYALYPYDDKVEKIDKIIINGVEYDTYKYEDNLGLHYVYRTKVKNDYHLFQYDVYGKEYIDEQVETFMNSVEYIYE